MRSGFGSRVAIEPLLWVELLAVGKMVKQLNRGLPFIHPRLH